MKNLQTAFALFIFLFLAKIPSNAQFGIGLGYNYTKYLGDFGEGNSGLNIRASYNLSEKGTINGGFVYGLPLKYNTTMTAYSSSSMTSPSYVEVEGEQQLSFKTFYLNYSRFFVKDNEEPFSVYGLVGAAVIVANFESKVKGSYDKTLYNLSGQGESESFTGFMIHAGIGAQFNFGPMSVFTEGILGIPANKVGNADVEITVPFNAGINLGTKYTFGSGKAS
ncbi:MAG TPA: outer membrane beta-barrel protein, partial [Cytophagaceae bacterium]